MTIIKRYSSILLFLLYALVPFFSIGQNFDEFSLEETQVENADTENKIVIPELNLWKLTGYAAFQDSTYLDTLIDFFHVYNPIYKDALTVSYVGNYGAPALNNDFFNRETDVDFLFLQSRSFYLLTPGQIIYYNTHTPYTRLDFSQSENRSVKNETRFNVFHSQNVNPYFNITFRMNIGKSVGQYNYQQGNNNFVTLYSSYNNDKFNLYTGFISNLIRNNENGGLVNDDLIFNGLDSELLNVNLNASKSKFNNLYFYAKGEYKFGKTIEIDSVNSRFRPIFGIIYNAEYQRNKQEFLEEEANNNDFFENTYYDNNYSKDSIRFNKVENVIQLKQYENAERKTSFGKRAFLGVESVFYNMPGVTSDIIARVNDNYTNLYTGGGIFRETGEFWKWNFSGKFYLLGRNVGQTELKGDISKPFRFLGDSLATLNIHGKISNKVADIFQEKFYSNHYQWDNDLKMEQRMVAGGDIDIPSRKLKVGANYTIINNYIYNDLSGIPSQTGKELLVISAFADKDFSLGNVHFRPRILWQKASDGTYIQLPEFSAFLSTYYQFVWSKVMHVQLGLDARYNTLYYADKYSPATGLFYLQNEKKYGNFPYLDAYANLRLKRTTVFFKMMNFGSQFLNGEYISTPNYPMPRSTFRFGISWIFYD
ncbi:MAG: putative porin [Prolixibacteraceae bacterium]|nr:putative porin [Prolixibacteraceae bacterium]